MEVDSDNRMQHNNTNTNIQHTQKQTNNYTNNYRQKNTTADKMETHKVPEVRCGSKSKLKFFAILLSHRSSRKLINPSHHPKL